jgi:thioredoxin-dependent peroxiredoxin
MVRLSVGDLAPDFTLEGTEGRFTLSEHRGELVVLLFYPGDDTSVCKKELCAYRHAGLSQIEATFVGIATQGIIESSYGRSTQLLADRNGIVSRAYGVYSSRFQVAMRTTFIVDEHGRITSRHANLLCARWPRCRFSVAGDRYSERGGRGKNPLVRAT